MPDRSLDLLLEVECVRESALNNIREAGWDSLDDVALATHNDLRDVEEINTSTAANHESGIYFPEDGINPILKDIID
jgi:hypothetical protein